MATANDFASVLREAIADLSEHGFDSVERVDRWVAALRAAARGAVGSADAAEKLVGESLAAIYQKLVDKGGISRFNPGVARFTLERVRPQLRAELDRRMVASAQLIKRNRDEAVEKTLQRFQGWATSVPVGGGAEIDKRALKSEFSKPLKQMDFATRRCVVDQSHKMTANISATLAEGSNAIAGEWRSNFRQKNYAFRPDHKERDGNIYLIRDSWAHKRGLVKPSKAGFVDDITKPAEEVFCLVGDSKIQLFYDAEKAFRRFYKGEIVCVTPRDNTRFRATPNHPVMTVNGWIAIGELNKGDYLVKISNEGVKSSELHANQTPATIANVHVAMRAGGSTKIRNGVRPDFHGDGRRGDVDVVTLAGPLVLYGQTLRFKTSKKFMLAATDFLRATLSTIGKRLNRFLNASHSCMALLTSNVFMLSDCRAASFANAIHYHCAAGPVYPRQIPAALACFVPLAQFDARWNFQSSLARAAGAQIDKPCFVPVEDGHGSHADCTRDFINRLSCGTQLMDVIDINRESFAGHVYNLQTASGWYGVEGVITSNCRCTYRYIYNLRQLPEEMLTVKGREELQAARDKVQRALAAPRTA